MRNSSVRCMGPGEVPRKKARDRVAEKALTVERGEQGGGGKVGRGERLKFESLIGRSWSGGARRLPLRRWPSRACGSRGTEPLRMLKVLKELLGDETGGLAPAAGHDEVADRLANARRSFAVAQRLRKGRGIARVADGESGDSIEAGRNVEYFSGGAGIEAGHLVDEKSARSGFDT